MQESIVFLLRVQCRRKESSRSLSHLLMSFLLIDLLVAVIARRAVEQQADSGITASAQQAPDNGR